VKFMKDAIPGLRMTDSSPHDDVTRAPLFAGGYNAVLLKYGESSERSRSAIISILPI
jgi:hypothetical protein